MARLEELPEAASLPVLPNQVSSDKLEDPLAQLDDRSQCDSVAESSSSSTPAFAQPQPQPLPGAVSSASDCPSGSNSSDNESDSESDSDSESSEELSESDEESATDSDSDSDNDSKHEAPGQLHPQPAAPLAMAGPASACNSSNVQDQIQSLEEKLDKVKCSAETQAAADKVSVEAAVRAPIGAAAAAAVLNSENDPRPAAPLQGLESGNEGKSAISEVAEAVHRNKSRRTNAKRVGLVILCFIIAFHVTHHSIRTRRQNELSGQAASSFSAHQGTASSFSVPIHSSLPPQPSNRPRSSPSSFASSEAESRSYHRSRASNRQKASERSREHAHEHSWGSFFHDRADSWRAKFAQEHEQRVKDMYAQIENAKAKLQRWPMSIFEAVKERYWNPHRSEDGGHTAHSQAHSQSSHIHETSPYALRAELSESRGLFREAMEDWNWAAKDDLSGLAEFRLGNRAYWGWGVEMNPQRAKELWAASARKGHLGGRARVLSQTDPLAALPLFIELAQSDVDALAIAAAHSLTARIDLLPELRECSQRGHALCQVQLAECYAHGCCGVPYHPTTAMRLLEAAEQSELWAAQLKLARLLSTPDRSTGAVADMNRAVQLYSNALWNSGENWWTSESVEATGAWKMPDARCLTV